MLPPDALQYVALAHDLESGYGDEESPLFVDGLLRPPGYPVFLAGVYGIVDSNVAAGLVQILLSVFTAALLYAIGTRLFGASAGLVAALLYSLDPTAAFHTSLLLSETVFNFLLVVAVLCLVVLRGKMTQWWAAAAGVTLGVAVLVRPIGTYLALALLPVVIGMLWPRRWRGVAASLIFVVTFAVPIGAWMQRNEVVTDHRFLSTAQGIDFLYYRAAGTLASAEDTDLRGAEQELSRRLQTRVDVPLTTLDSPPELALLNQAQTDLAVDVIADHPVGFLEATARYSIPLMFGPGKGTYERLLGAGGVVDVLVLGITGASLLVLGVAYLGAVAGAVELAKRRSWSVLWLALGPILYFFLASAEASAHSRYRLPMLPFVFLLAGHGWNVLARLRSAQGRTENSTASGQHS